jgi:hypothetical protein
MTNNSDLIFETLLEYECTYDKFIEIRNQIPQGFHIEIYLDDDDMISFSSPLTANSHSKEETQIGAIAWNTSDIGIDGIVEDIHKEIRAQQLDRIGL